MWKRDCRLLLKYGDIRGFSRWNFDEIFFPGCEEVAASMYGKHLPNKRKISDHRSHASVVDKVPIDIEEGVEFQSQVPVYSDEMGKFVEVEVKIGSTFDVLSLLSKPCPNSSSNHLVRITNGKTDASLVQVDSLKGKYIVLCCVFIPQLVDFPDSDLLHHLSLLSHEMSDRKDIEMVLVLNVRPQWSFHPRAVTHFVKPFSCLAVPWDHHPRIDYICRAINMGSEPAGLLVDPNQVVIKDSLRFAFLSGMDAFPFTVAHVRSDQSLANKRPVPLERLLGHAFVYRLVGETAGIAGLSFDTMLERTSVAYLRHKLVGLYLYITGDDMPMLRDVYHQCQSKGLEFEVVVACLPFDKIARPQKLEKAIADILKKMSLPWWVLPFNNSVFHRLHVHSRVDISDRLFIVLPDGKLMDPHGELVALHFGVDAYPFTRETVIKKALDKLRPLTLESTLLGGVLYRQRDQISVTDIQGKNVILCLCSDDEIQSKYKLLYRNYSQLKAKDPDFEVVFACIDTHISYFGHLLLSFMPWLVYLRDPSKSEFVAEDLNVWGMKTQKMVAFGKDGHICSIKVDYLLRCYGPSAYPFEGDLVDEIVGELEIDNFMSDMVWSGRP